PHYMPGNKPLIFKLVYDEGTGRVLGAQIVGPGEVLPRINTVAAVIKAGGTIEELADVELAYAPPFSPAIDILTTAAWASQNKLYRLARSYKAKEVKAKLEAGEDFVLLDVRTPKEIEEVRLPYENVVYIPLGKLREEAPQKLPRDKEIICFCKISLRGFEAVRILAGLGFKNVAYLEGGLAAWPYEKVSG
ncbi:MAG: pyridine nucleotide-disulfide oxidoreductase, partial [Thermodesulfobacteria bacterium]|nr:pyridine nucleotide-disulfide oxidoreductase [Thermodesulfobacteriota bacterium]